MNLYARHWNYVYFIRSTLAHQISAVMLMMLQKPRKFWIEANSTGLTAIVKMWVIIYVKIVIYIIKILLFIKEEIDLFALVWTSLIERCHITDI